ncbi:MAG: hypothetical protein KAY32_00165 [Candidatus Eisenbacteria sp.]|nr:hypothetical protein [Candidatus Eisenbacteria bacterium]
MRDGAYRSPRDAAPLLGAARLLGAALLLLALGHPTPGSADETAPAQPVRAGVRITADSPEPEPVTISVKNMEIKDVLTMLSRSRELNLVCGGEVEGRVSIDLHKVPFDQALRAVVAMAGFEVTRSGNIYFVRQDPNGDPREAMVREVRTYRLDYAQPAEILPVLQQGLSPIGRATAYTPLRSIVIEDRPDVLDRTGAIIAALDVPPRQVLIEARIMEARLSRDMRMGIDWSLFFSQGEGSGMVNVEGFSAPADVGGEGFFLTWGQGDFAAALQSLEGVEELSTMAAPRLLATDGSQAEIIVGGQLGFSVLTTVENTIIQSVEFLDTGAQLRITPTIAGDGYVLMHIRPEVSDGIIDEGLPSKSTSQVTTDVLIKDGHTLFIGGLIKEREEKSRKGIPLLIDIPLLGHLFGRTITSTQRTELIIVITPHILEPGQEAAVSSIGLVEQPH